MQDGNNQTPDPPVVRYNGSPSLHPPSAFPPLQPETPSVLHPHDGDTAMLIDPHPMDHVTRPTYASKVGIQPLPGAKRDEPWKCIRQHTVTRQPDSPRERIVWAAQEAPKLAAI
ncbi:hypothetical protein BGZ73_001704, partial [Actinomortierella ambigua]